MPGRRAEEGSPRGRGGEPIRSYLNIPAIIGLAKEKEVDAIHPGYGFLSENPEFARACEAAGIIWVGPRPELLERLGDKVAARALPEEAPGPPFPGPPPPAPPPPHAPPPPA